MKKLFIILLLIISFSLMGCDKSDIEGAKSEIKFALIKSGMKVNDEGNE